MILWFKKNYYISIILFTIIVDQLTKILVATNITLGMGERHWIIKNLFELVHIRNGHIRAHSL